MSDIIVVTGGGETVVVTPTSEVAVVEVNSGATDHTQLTNIGTNTHAQIDSHIASTSNPHSVTKTQLGLGNVDNTSDANKPVSTATQTALNGKVDENAAITGATKTKITYDAKGLVTSGADLAASDLPVVSPDKGGFGLTQATTSIVKNTSSNVNNLALAGGFIVYSGSYGGGGWSLTGMVAQADGVEIIILNNAPYGSPTITISQESGSSTAANRFSFEAAIAPQAALRVKYSTTSSRWASAGQNYSNATASIAGLVSTGTQQFGGDKEFTTLKVNTSLGLFGVSPVGQQSTSGSTTGFSQNSGNSVYDASTFAGSSSGTAYTIDDIVEALKKFGLLAQ